MDGVNFFVSECTWKGFQEAYFGRLKLDSTLIGPAQLLGAVEDNTLSP